MILLERIHLIGIGGAAMAPLAGMLKERGYHVTGSDANVYPPASTLLEGLSIPWKEGFSEDNLRPRPDLVVIGNAISRGNPEVERSEEHTSELQSLAYLVCRLLLEKKKKKNTQHHHIKCKRTIDALRLTQTVI